MLVHEFQWDDENEAKINRRLGVRSVDSLLDDDVLVLRNKQQRGKPQRYRLIGRDYSGRWITVVAEPTVPGEGIWRPITAWESTKAEKSAARRE